jgi:hypothetical protein
MESTPVMKISVSYKYYDVKNQNFQAICLRSTINRTLGSTTRKDMELLFYKGKASPALLYGSLRQWIAAQK